MIVLDHLNLMSPKPKILSKYWIHSKLIRKPIVTADGTVMWPSQLEYTRVKPLKVDFINVYDLLKYDTLLITRCSR